MKEELFTKYDGEFDVTAQFEPTYDKTKVYNKYLKDLVEEIRYICDMNHIPFFTTFAVGNNEKGTKYISEAVSTGSRNYTLTDNRINRHLLINSGFIVEPPAQAVPMEKSELEYIAQVDEDDEDILEI